MNARRLALAAVTIPVAALLTAATIGIVADNRLDARDRMAGDEG